MFHKVTVTFLFIITCGFFLGEKNLGSIALASPLTRTPMAAHETAKELQDIGITENLGANVDLNLLVRDEKGEERPLSYFFKKGRPVLLSLVYFNCPGLCSLHLNGVLDGLKELNWTAGEQFEFLTLSFDSQEGSSLAEAKKVNYLKNYGRSDAAKGWHFLTAPEVTVKSLTEAVGFKFKWDDKASEWAHSSAAIFLSPEGKITRYLHGVMFSGDQLKLAFNEAAAGRVGTVVDRLVWYCFKYDPQQSKYVVYAFRLVQIGGGLIIIVLALLLLPTWWRERRKNSNA